MSIQVLIVDDIAFNVKLLESKLAYEFYETIVATNGAEAIEAAKKYKPDIILMDIMMPTMDGFEATKIIKEDPELHHIPIIMLTALSTQQDKVKGLQCGAEDFLTKPINENALLSRLRSLIRLKTLLDELMLRDKTNLSFGINAKESIEKRNKISGKNVLIIDDDTINISNATEKLSVVDINVDATSSTQQAITMSQSKEYSLVIISTQMVDNDGLRAFSHLRAQSHLRNSPFLMYVDAGDEMTLNRGLELGIDDYLVSPLDMNELLARCVTQIKRKNFQDALKDNVRTAVNEAIKDPLTNMYNRRYLDEHLKQYIAQTSNHLKNMSIIMVDIDHFKEINDTYGHQVGDEVLKEFSKRMLFSTRAGDFCARYGGEEFAIILSYTNKKVIHIVAERIRGLIENSNFPISINPPGSIKCTASFGIANIREGDTPESLIKRADDCLYQAKSSGRNKVVSEDDNL